MRRVVALPAFVLVAAACSNNVFDLEIGQCFDDPDSFDEVANVAIVDCAEPHDNEVYYLFDLAGGDFPGDAGLGDSAVDGCLDQFDGYVGVDYASSVLDIRYLIPTAETWRDGDREVVCILYQLDNGELTGSMRGAGV